MPRRTAAVALALAVGLTLAGCSGDDGPDAPAEPTLATPTAVGDRPLVEVLDAGGEDRRVLTLSPAPDVPVRARIAVTQEVARDEQATQVPPVTVPFTSVATTDGTGTTGATVTATQTYGEATVDATGLTSADVAGVREALAALAGTDSTLVVRPDGTTVEAASGTEASAPFDEQVRDLVPVLPAEPVGVGARWSATSVDEVGGAVVDQVATYTLRSLEGDDYGIDVTIEQTYRPGPLETVEVRSGLGTVDARLTGSLTQLLPARASADVGTQVSYVIAGQTSEVRTTVTLDLRAR